MALGSHHQDSGMLLRDAHGLVLLRDDRGRGRLKVDQEAASLAGRRVRVAGVRTGFDLLSVETIAPC
jgi:hypothetical protein